jgi:hypothetical protein
VSGIIRTWWVNSLPDFDPDATVPVPAGGFSGASRNTAHYDGVIKGIEGTGRRWNFWPCS